MASSRLSRFAALPFHGSPARTLCPLGKSVARRYYAGAGPLTPKWNFQMTKQEPQLGNHGIRKQVPLVSSLSPCVATKSALRLPVYPEQVIGPIGNCLARRHYADKASVPMSTSEPKKSNNSSNSDVDAKPVRRFRGPPDGKTTPMLASKGPQDPKAVALGILDAMPFNSVVTKGGCVIGGAGAIVWLISKEIYVFNEDSILCFCTFTLLYLLIKFCSGPLQQFFLDRRIHVWTILQQARDRHRDIIKSRIDEVDKMSDIVDVTKNLFAMSKDMARLEAQSFELKQKLALHNEIKGVLDSWVRHEAAVRQREQSEIAHTVIERVRERLQDPKVQEQIMQQAVMDVERLVTK